MAREKKVIVKKGNGRGPMTKAHREAIAKAMRERWARRKQETVGAGDYQIRVVSVDSKGNEGSFSPAPVFQAPRSISRVLIEIGDTADKLRDLYDELHELTGRS